MLGETETSAEYASGYASDFV